MLSAMEWVQSDQSRHCGRFAKRYVLVLVTVQYHPWHPGVQYKLEHLEGRRQLITD